MASAALNRLQHKSTTFNNRIESYRLQEKRAAGLPSSVSLRPENADA